MPAEPSSQDVEDGCRLASAGRTLRRDKRDIARPRHGSCGSRGSLAAWPGSSPRHIASPRWLHAETGSPGFDFAGFSVASDQRPMVGKLSSLLRFFEMVGSSLCTSSRTPPTPVSMLVEEDSTSLLTPTADVPALFSRLQNFSLDVPDVQPKRSKSISSPT